MTSNKTGGGPCTIARSFNFSNTFVAKISVDPNSNTPYTHLLIDSISLFGQTKPAYGYLVTPYKFNFSMYDPFIAPDGCYFGIYCGSPAPIGFLNGNTITMNGNSNCDNSSGQYWTNDKIDFVLTMVKQ